MAPADRLPDPRGVIEPATGPLPGLAARLAAAAGGASRRHAGLPGPRRALSRLCRVLLVAYVAAVTLPGGFSPIYPGVDGSWVYALNYLPGSPYRFGRDVVFTIGPLG